jgi:uncharacterized membrane protein YhdT
MAAACITAALYYFDVWKTSQDAPSNSHGFHNFMIWCSLAALANGIALYTIFSMLVIIIFKYHKNIISLSNLPYFLIFLFEAAYVVFTSRAGKSLASTNNFYDCIIAAVFNTFSLSVSFLPALLFALFVAILVFGLVKTKGLSDYGWIYLVFVFVCFISNIVFHRGYPLSREMIPFYPVIVLVIADVLKNIKPGVLVKTITAAAGLLLFFQFIVQIDLRINKDWQNDSRVRKEIILYAAAHPIENDIEAFDRFIDDFHNPAADFYAEKFKLNISRNK